MLRKQERLLPIQSKTTPHDVDHLFDVSLNLFLSRATKTAMETPPPSITCTPSSDSNFACQRCCQPLKMHASFDDLDEKSRAELMVGSKQHVERSTDPGCDIICKPVEALKLSESGSSGNNGFLVIGEQGQSVRHPISHCDQQDLNYKLQVTSRLFDILTDQSGIKHPLCEDCADFLIDQMDNRLEKLEDECKEFRDYLMLLEKKSTVEEREKEEKLIKDLESQCDQLKKEEEDILRQLQEMDSEQKLVEHEVESQRHELAQIEKDEKSYWLEYNHLKRNYYSCEDELQSVSCQLRYSQMELEKLKKTNVFNLTFHIWYVYNSLLCLFSYLAV